jgi:hypothetical protein
MTHLSHTITHILGILKLFITTTGVRTSESRGYQELDHFPTYPTTKKTISLIT